MNQNRMPSRPDASAHKPAADLIAWVFTLTIIGYPLAGMVTAAFYWPSFYGSYPFRLGVALLSCILLLRAILLRLRTHIDAPLLIFSTAYVLRLFWDLVVAQIPGAEMAFVFFVATVLLPSVAVVTGIRMASEEEIARLMFLVGTAVSFIAVGLLYFGIGQGESGLETGRLSFDAVNPITLGHAGATTLIAAISCWYQARRAIPFWLFAIGTTAGAICLVMAASRGPFVALGACLIVFAIGRKKWGLLAVALAMLLYSVTQIPMDRLEILQRFSTVSEDESSLERLLIQANAIQQFLQNPWFGSAYAELISGQYPHNLFIETAMALGVGGLLLVVVIIIRASRASLVALRSNSLLVPLLFVQYFVAAQFSGSIWGAGAFWASTTFILARYAPRGLTHSKWTAVGQTVNP
jgi:O-antigen ligase